MYILTISRSRRLRLTFRACIAQGKIGISLIFCLVPNQTQYSSHNIPHDHFLGLRGHQSSPHRLDALNQPGGLGGPTSRDDTEKQIGGCRSA